MRFAIFHSVMWILVKLRLANKLRIPYTDGFYYVFTTESKPSPPTNHTPTSDRYIYRPLKEGNKK